MKPITKSEIKEAFAQIGLRAGTVVMVHTSLSAIGYVCGGAQTVIEALTETVEPEGTIMMPAQSWKNRDPEDGVHWNAEEEYWQIIRDNWPAYDKRITPTNTMGAVAEMFRSWPGAIRSDHPARSVAAWGKNADYLVSNHDLSNIFGDGSPIGKLYELDGSVLLIGVGYDKNTSLHLADVRASYPGKHNCIEHSAIAERYNVRNLVILSLKPTSQNELAHYPTKDQIKSVARYVCSYRGRVNLRIEPCYSCLNTALKELSEKLSIHSPAFSGCLAGHGIISVNVDGEITPCRHLDIPENYNTIEDYWKDSAVLKQIRQAAANKDEPCKSCVYREGCLQCLAVNYSDKGQIRYGFEGCPMQEKGDKILKLAKGMPLPNR